MTLSNIKSPGVYIDEVNGFGNSVVPVATAVPAFIGYTPQAKLGEESYTNVPFKISSFSEFKSIFCLPDPAPPADPAKQYSPQYYLVAQQEQPTEGDFLQIGDTYYTVVPDPNSVYYLYNSVRLFYENGGGDAYIVSVGSYGAPSGNPVKAGDQFVNANVKLTELSNGLALLKEKQEPTMYICPEATLLSTANNGTLMQEMLSQAEEMGTAICIFDIIGGKKPNPLTYTNDISAFRNNTGVRGLKYGAAYYPFVGTTIMQDADIDYTNLFGGDLAQLKSFLSPAGAPNQAVENVIASIENPSGKVLTVSENNKALKEASDTYVLMIDLVLQDANLLPTSGGMAGVITKTDNQIGPWQSPANTSIVGVTSLPIHLTDEQQGNLNVDAVSGKSVNAIRFFNGPGIVVWGARTLDGNSLDWRYLSVRRTITFIEQTCKLATKEYVFHPNIKNTWEILKATLSSFLTSVWQDGGLQGAKASDAYSVECGLGSTMTAEDITNGFMRVAVKVAVLHPADFIVITLEQEMATSS